MSSEADEVLYGGAAGGGKSYALRAWGVRYCMTYPNANIVLFRRTYRELEETHIVKLKTEVPTAVATYHPASHYLEFKNGSKLWLRFCEKDEDARSYDTAEYDAMLFDELTHFTFFQYTYLLSRCRSTQPWWPGPRIRSGATPLGLGHGWVKERFVDAKVDGKRRVLPFEVWKSPVAEGGMTRQFIPAKVADNPSIDPEYLTRLKGLPEEEYRAKALGDWSVPTGQFFTRWRDDIHIIEPFNIPPDWDKWICHDYGFNAPMATLWLARPPGTGTYFFYRERYGPGIKHEQQVTDAYDATDAIAEKLKAVVLDPQLFKAVNVKGDRLAPMSDDWRDAFSKICSVVPGKNDRVPGWSLMRTLIDWKEGPNGKVIVAPRLYVFSTCRNLARTLPLLVVDDHNLEDVDTDGEDHAPDAARYGLMHAERGRSLATSGMAGGFQLTSKGLVVVQV